MSEADRKMLDLAAAEHRLLRQALHDAVAALEALRARDTVTKNIWDDGGLCGHALYQAKKVLAPRYPILPDDAHKK